MKTILVALFCVLCAVFASSDVFAQDCETLKKEGSQLYSDWNKGGKTDMELLKKAEMAYVKAKDDQKCAKTTLLSVHSMIVFLSNTVKNYPAYCAAAAYLFEYSPKDPTDAEKARIVWCSKNKHLTMMAYEALLAKRGQSPPPKEEAKPVAVVTPVSETKKEETKPAETPKKAEEVKSVEKPTFKFAPLAEKATLPESTLLKEGGAVFQAKDIGGMKAGEQPSLTLLKSTAPKEKAQTAGGAMFQALNVEKPKVWEDATEEEEEEKPKAKLLPKRKLLPKKEVKLEPSKVEVVDEEIPMPSALVLEEEWRENSVPSVTDEDMKKAEQEFEEAKSAAAIPIVPLIAEIPVEPQAMETSAPVSQVVAVEEKVEEAKPEMSVITPIQEPEKPVEKPVEVVTPAIVEAPKSEVVPITSPPPVEEKIVPISLPMPSSMVSKSEPKPQPVVAALPKPKPVPVVVPKPKPEVQKVVEPKKVIVATMKKAPPLSPPKKKQSIKKKVVPKAEKNNVQESDAGVVADAASAPVKTEEEKSITVEDFQQMWKAGRLGKPRWVQDDEGEWVQEFPIMDAKQP